MKEYNGVCIIGIGTTLGYGHEEVDTAVLKTVKNEYGN